MKRRLSQQAVDRLTGKAGEVVWDTSCPGFGVAIGATVHSYVIQRRVAGGKSKRETIGRCADLRYDAALAQAQARLREIGGAEAAGQRLTLGAALEAYITYRKDNLRPRTAEGYRYALHKYCPDWLGMDVSKIAPAMVQRRHSEVGETVGRQGTKLTSTANGLMRTLRTILNYARHRDQTLGANAVAVGLYRGMYRENRREGHVPPERMAEFWAAAEGLESRTMSAFVRMLLATGMRSGECRAMRWEWVGNDAIIIPETVTKGRRPLRVPLTTLVRSIITERRKARAPGCPFVFPARVVGQCLQAPGKAFDAIAAKTGIAVTPHDLRRSWVGCAREAGISDLHLKRLVNHVGTDITDRYHIVGDAELARAAQQVADAIAERCGLDARQMGALAFVSARH
jgi:integrase